MSLNLEKEYSNCSIFYLEQHISSDLDCTYVTVYKIFCSTTDSSKLQANNTKYYCEFMQCTLQVSAFNIRVKMRAVV